MKSIVALVLILTFVGCAYSIKISDFIDRTWAFGGKFTSITQPDGAVDVANNIAIWNGTYFETFNGGADGTVRSIVVDECRNVYIAGDFTEIGGVQTGPLAVWKFGETEVKKIGEFTVNGTASIRALSVDCFNKPDFGNKECVCDVYAAGDFQFDFVDASTKSVSANNIAKYDASSKKWDNLGGAAQHKIESVARTVFKKAFLDSASKVVHVAGDGFYKQYLKETKVWTDVLVDDNVNFNSLYYDPEIFSTDQIFFAGEFAIKVSETETCNNVCEYNRKTKKWSVLGKTNTPTSEVKFISGNGDDVYTAGNFNNAPLSYVGLLKDGSNEWATIATSDSTVVTEEMNALTVCSKTSVNCKSGSITLVGDFGFAAFYDAKKKEWTSFGTTFKPFSHNVKASIYAVETWNSWNAGSRLSLNVACLIAVLFAVLAAIF